MAPPHAKPSRKAIQSRGHNKSSNHDRKSQSSIRKHRPALQATRLNKAPLSGSRIAKSRALSLQASDARVSKRRRPRTKAGKEEGILVDGGLSGLGDALPVTETENGTVGAKDAKGGAQKKVTIARSSLKSRPGAQKKRAIVERGERERFGLNLAVLASVNEDSTSDNAKEKTHPVNKWEALRQHISGALQTG